MKNIILIINQIYIITKSICHNISISLFNTVHRICKELLYNKFNNELIEIPRELQLYNIINFITAPVNESLNITFFSLYDLSEITKCESDKDLIYLNDQRYIISVN